MYENFKEIIETAPGPSPWYLNPSVARIESQRGTWEWMPYKRVGARDSSPLVGKTLLRSPDESVLVILDFQCYVQPLERRRFLVWTVESTKWKVPSKKTFFVFRILDADQLQPISDPVAACEEMKQAGINVYTAGGEIARFTMTTDLEEGFLRIPFPDAIHTLPEILLLGHSTAIKKDPNQMGLCIYSAWPAAGTVEVFPQDWFNHADYDFGYQWVTRVARDPITRRIFGEGIRLGGFVLEETNRSIERWVHHRHHPA